MKITVDTNVLVRVAVQAHDALDVIEKAEEMNISGLYFHRLKGNQKDEYSVSITRVRSYFLS